MFVLYMNIRNEEVLGRDGVDRSVTHGRDRQTVEEVYIWGPSGKLKPGRQRRCWEDEHEEEMYDAWDHTGWREVLLEDKGNLASPWSNPP